MPWNLGERLFAAYYPQLAAKSERAGQAAPPAGGRRLAPQPA